MQALATLTFDEEREPLKSVYSLQVACEHHWGTSQRRAPPRSGCARWCRCRHRAWRNCGIATLRTRARSRRRTRSAKPAGDAVELIVDSDPPNARVAMNFHIDGVTPRTVKVAPGVVYVEMEKAGFKKAFRKVTVEKVPVRVVFPLLDRRPDRAAQVESAVTRLRGSDPATHPTTLARLAELARVDVLVAMMVRAGTVDCGGSTPNAAI